MSRQLGAHSPLTVGGGVCLYVCVLEGELPTRTVVFITPVPWVRIELAMCRMLIVFRCYEPAPPRRPSDPHTPHPHLGRR